MKVRLSEAFLLDCFFMVSALVQEQWFVGFHREHEVQMKSLWFGCFHRELVVQMRSWLFTNKSSTLRVVLLSSLQDFRLVIVSLSFTLVSFECLFMGLLKECYDLFYVSFLVCSLYVLGSWSPIVGLVSGEVYVFRRLQCFNLVSFLCYQ